MSNLQGINDLHKKAIRTIKGKIDKIDQNEKSSNSDEKRSILVETMIIINVIFKAIRENVPNEIKNLSIKHSPMKVSVLQQSENILNIIGLCLFTTSKTTFEITAVNDAI